MRKILFLLAFLITFFSYGQSPDRDGVKIRNALYIVYNLDTIWIQSQDSITLFYSLDSVIDIVPNGATIENLVSVIGADFSIGSTQAIKQDPDTNLIRQLGGNYLAGSQNSAISGSANSAFGFESLKDNTSGYSNVAVGYRAFENNLSGFQSVIIGQDAASTSTINSNITAVGFKALEDNISANNVAFGFQAGLQNTVGTSNTFIGYSAGSGNTTGADNTYVGLQSGLAANGNYNTAVGKSTLGIASGDYNTAVGVSALSNNTTGVNNVGISPFALLSNLNGYDNIALGYTAMQDNTSGNENIAIGEAALKNNETGGDNVAIGDHALWDNETGSQNVAIGYNTGRHSGISQEGCVYIGYQAGQGDSTNNKLYIENSTADSNNALIWGDFADDVLAFNANVGIGTTAPTAKLEVNSNADWGTSDYFAKIINLDPTATEDDGLLVQGGGNSADADVLSVKDLSGNLDFNVYGDGETYMRGNVGIGTTAPTSPLSIVSGTANTGNVGSTGLNIASLNQLPTSALGTIIAQSNDAQAADKGGSISLGGRYVDASTLATNFAQIKAGKTNSISGNVSGYMTFHTINHGGTFAPVERMRIDNLGNVGIGTTAPTAKLEVIQSTTNKSGIYVDNSNATTTFGSQYGGLYLANENTTNDNFVRLNFGDGDANAVSSIATQITNHANEYGDLLFWTRSAGGFNQKMVIESTGNVGIGTTAPRGKLDVNGDIYLTGTSAGRYVYGDTDTNYVRLSTDAGAILNSGSGSKVARFTAVSNALTLTTSDSPRMTVLSGGNVGIGTTNPNSKLTVDQDASVEALIVRGGGGGKDVAQFIRDVGSTGQVYINSNAGDPQIGFISTNEWQVGMLTPSYDFSIAYGNTQLVTSTSVFYAEFTTGNVGIGTTAPTAKLDVNGAIVSGSDTISSSSDATDVSGANIVWINTNSGNVTVGAFTGGVIGQVLHIVIYDASNNFILEHNEGTGNQNIFLNGSGDVTITADYGGFVLVCNGTSWFESGH